MTMRNWKWWATKIFIVVSHIGWLIWTWQAPNWGVPQISKEEAFWGEQINTVPFLWGVLQGHWWGLFKTPITTAWGWCIPFILTQVLVDVLSNIYGWNHMGWRWPLLHLYTGTIVGSIFWGQRSRV